MSIQIICGSQHMGLMSALMKEANQCAENGQKVVITGPLHIMETYRSGFSAEENILLFETVWYYNVEKLKEYRDYTQCDVIVIDMINMMWSKSSTGYVESLEEFEELFNELKIFSEQENVNLYLGRYLPPMVARREDKRPLLSDLTPAEQEANEVIGVYRDIVYHPEQTREDVIELLDLKRNQRAGIILNKRNILY